MAPWIWRSYGERTLDELYDILALRQAVFVVEQRCAYLDADGLDHHAHHLFLRSEGGKIEAYLRVLAPGVKYAEPSIGRVITHPEVRRAGLGMELMRQGISHAARAYPGTPIRIGAQRRLERFYAVLGFDSIGEPYDEDGIEHVEMIWLPGRTL